MVLPEVSQGKSPESLLGLIHREYLHVEPVHEYGGRYSSNSLSLVLGRLAQAGEFDTTLTPSMMKEIHSRVAPTIYGFDKIEAGRRAQAQRYNENSAIISQTGSLEA